MNELIQLYYQENYKPLVKKMYSRFGSVEDAEDIVQEAFSRAIKYYPSFDPEKCKQFENWFNSILKNVAKKFMNDKKLGGLSKPLDDATDEIEPVIVDYLRSVTSKELYKFIKDRSEEDRHILRLNIIYGYTPSEIEILTPYTNRKIRDTLYKFSVDMQELYPNDRGSV